MNVKRKVYENLSGTETIMVTLHYQLVYDPPAASLAAIPAARHSLWGSQVVVTGLKADAGTPPTLFHHLNWLLGICIHTYFLAMTIY